MSGSTRRNPTPSPKSESALSAGSFGVFGNQVITNRKEDDMCNAASFVITKSKVFWSKRSDHHEEIITEHKLNADGVRGPNIVRVEISPTDGDLRKPIAEWVFKTDQPETPDWYDPKEAERRTRETLKHWAAYKVRTSGVSEIREGQCYARATLLPVFIRPASHHSRAGLMRL